MGLWITYVLVHVALCLFLVAFGAFLIYQSLQWVPAADDRRWPSFETPPGPDSRPWTVTWQPTADAPDVWYRAPYPGREAVSVHVGSPRVWYDPKDPSVMRAYWEDRPVSTLGLILVCLGAPSLVAIGVALARTRRVHC